MSRLSAISLLALLTLTACGGATSTPSSAPSASDTPTASDSAPMTSPTPSAKTHPVQAGTFVADIRAALQEVGTFKASGPTDFIPSEPSAQETSTIEVDVSDPDNHKLHIVQTRGAATREYIFIDGFMYTKALDGSGWLKRPITGDADNPYLGYFLLPDDATAQEQQAASETGGQDTLNGEEVRHFVVQSPNPNLNADVYVGMDGIPRHVTGTGYSLDITAPGAPVDIPAPDPATVTEG